MPPAKKPTATQSEEPQASPVPDPATSALDEKPALDAPASDPIPTPADIAPTEPDAPAETAPPALDTLDVVMKVQISGTRNGEDWPAPGQIITLSKAEAATLLAHRMATLPPKPAIETAIARAAVETATVTGKDSIKAQESAD